MPNKTCQEYSKHRRHLEKIRTDEASRLYKQIYNSKNNKARRCKTEENPGGNPVFNADLDWFVSESAQWKTDISSEIRAKDDYIAWLRNVKEGKGGKSDGKHN